MITTDELNKKRTVNQMKRQHPNIVTKLSTIKDKKGNPLFSTSDIDTFLYIGKETIEKEPDKITAVLNNPAEIEAISSFKENSRGFELFKATIDPLVSTIQQNPQIFPRQAEYANKNNKDLKNRYKSPYVDKKPNKKIIIKNKNTHSL